MNSSIRESDFEILIAVFAGTMTHRAIRVISSRHESAVRDKVLIRDESFDAVYLKIHRECSEFADAWDVQEALNVIVGN